MMPVVCFSEGWVGQAEWRELQRHRRMVLPSAQVRAISLAKLWMMEKIMTPQGREFIRKGHLGFYRNEIFQGGEVAAKSGMFMEALEKYFICAFLDCLGCSNEQRPKFDSRFSGNAPGVIKRMAKCINYLKLNKSELEGMYSRAAESEAVEIRKLGVFVPIPSKYWANIWNDLLPEIESGTIWRPRRKT
ncbi:hypothetical protein P7L79_22110 [Tistrella mobilis]|uniref:hypothetical protein n=1 Tax=Tistrella mobilis TaxID=171437 RepID=UPI00355632AA